MVDSNKIILFEDKHIRRVWYESSWFFSVVDVIGFLTESVEPRNYWATLKKRELQLLTNCQQLKMKAIDGRSRLTDYANTEGILRI